MFDRILTAATIILTVCATVVAALRVRDAVSPNTVDESAPVRVSNWQKYSSAGQRSGAVKPTVTVVEFSDFQCPFCSKAAIYLDSLQRRYPKDVAVIYRHYPVHSEATAAAIAAECAADVGAFRPIHDLFFQNRDSIGKRSWTSFASAAGIRDTASFKDCMNRREAANRVVRDTIAAHDLGVHGTPTFVINDVRVAGYPGAESLDKLVLTALDHAKH